MNENQAKPNSNTNPTTSSTQDHANWDHVRSSARKSWPKLTDDDLVKANGSVDALTGIIHNKFGESREAIKTKLTANVSSHASKDRKSTAAPASNK